MKNKKFLSVIMVLMLVLTQIFAGGFKAKAANPITVNVRVEGLSSTIMPDTQVSGTDEDNALVLTKNALGSKKIQFTTAESWGSEIITEINSLKQGKFGGYDGWMYYVKSGTKVINPQVGMAAYKPVNGDTIILYYTDFTVPIVSAIRFTPDVVKENSPFEMQFINQAGLPIVNANVKVDSTSLVTNQYGKVNVDGLANGEHNYEITGYNGENKVSTVVKDSGKFNIDGVTSLNINYDNSKDSALGNGDNTKIVKNIPNDIKILSEYFKNNGNDAWSAVSLRKLGIKPDDGFIKEYSEDVKKNGIKDTPNTDLEKMIIGITAAGYTPYDFQGNDLVSELLNRDINSFQINDAIFALIAYEYANIPESYKITKQNLIDKVLEKKFTCKINGSWEEYPGWALIYNKDNPFIDPDITGAAISALSPYYKTNGEVKKTVDGAVKALSLLQDQSGYIKGKYGIASESLSFVIMGLCSVGVNPEGSDFIKIKGDLVSALLSFKTQNGTFKHTLDGEENLLATEQAFRALVTLKDFKENGSSDFYKNNIDASKLTKYAETASASDTNNTKDTLPKTGSGMDNNVLIGFGTIMILTGLVVLALKKKEKSLH